MIVPEKPFRVRPRHKGPLDAPKLLEILRERPDGWSASELIDRIAPAPRLGPLLAELESGAMIERFQTRRTRFGRPRTIYRALPGPAP